MVNYIGWYIVSEIVKVVSHVLLGWGSWGSVFWGRHCYYEAVFQYPWKMDTKILGHIVSKKVFLKLDSLSSSVVEEETRRSQQAARDKQSPSQANGCSDHRPIDILEMLSRAKDEYERVRICVLNRRTRAGRRPVAGLVGWRGHLQGQQE